LWTNLLGHKLLELFKAAGTLTDFVSVNQKCQRWNPVCVCDARSKLAGKKMRFGL